MIDNNTFLIVYQIESYKTNNTRDDIEITRMIKRGSFSEKIIAVAAFVYIVTLDRGLSLFQSGCG